MTIFSFFFSGLPVEFLLAWVINCWLFMFVFFWKRIIDCLCSIIDHNFYGVLRIYLADLLTLNIVVDRTYLWLSSARRMVIYSLFRIELQLSILKMVSSFLYNLDLWITISWALIKHHCYCEYCICWHVNEVID